MCWPQRSFYVNSPFSLRPSLGVINTQNKAGQCVLVQSFKNWILLKMNEESSLILATPDLPGFGRPLHVGENKSGTFSLCSRKSSYGSFCPFERRGCHFTDHLARIVPRGGVYWAPRDRMFHQRTPYQEVPLPSGQWRLGLKQVAFQEMMPCFHLLFVLVAAPGWYL